jgi:hypothetical protein
MHGTNLRIVGVLAIAITAIGPPLGETEVIGKNPGKSVGRWLDVADPAALGDYSAVYMGEVSADIQWKKESNEAPIEEDLLAEHLHDEIVSRLRETGVLGTVLEETPEAGAGGYLRLDCDVVVEPGSRAARYAFGLGTGKSRSILEIHLIDHASGEEIGLYHGHGIGTGIGLKLVGGGARKMTQDDNQENAKKFVELLAKLKR